MGIHSICSSANLCLSLAPKPIFKLTLDLAILEFNLKICQNLKHFDQILSQTILTGILKDTYAATKLLEFSADSPFVHIHHCTRIFNCVENSNVRVWNTMMRAYVHRNFPGGALCLYKSMLFDRVAADNFTFPKLIQASALRVTEFEGKQLHGHVLKVGFDSDVYAQNTLVNMYSACGNMRDACKLFDQSSVLDSVSWNSILAGYVLSENVEEAVYIFDKMVEKSVIASNSMIKLFGNKGFVEEARKVFEEMPDRGLVSWSALISCYEKNQMDKDAVVAFLGMIGHGVMPDEIVMLSVLSACANLPNLWLGSSVHSLAVKVGCEAKVNLQNALIKMYSRSGDIEAAESLFNSGNCLDMISWNSMVYGYMRCRSFDKAKNLFNSMPQKDIFSWGAMISGYEMHDQIPEMLQMFQGLLARELKPDERILVSVVSACARFTSLEHGQWIHTYINDNNLNINAILGTSLIDMYMKCGCPENALTVFSELDHKGVSTWNALISGFAMNSLVDKSLEIFSEMKQSKVNPNEITFLAILSACRHAGLVEEGRHHFSSMVNEYKIEPDVKHYGCMVDLLGRAGLLREAEDLIKSMPMEPDVATWGALLGACDKHGDYEIGVRIGRKAIEHKPDHDGFHVLLSRIYALKGDWESVVDIREIMSGKGVVKNPGCSVVCKENIHKVNNIDKVHQVLTL